MQCGSKCPLAMQVIPCTASGSERVVSSAHGQLTAITHIPRRRVTRGMPTVGRPVARIGPWQAPGDRLHRRIPARFG